MALTDERRASLYAYCRVTPEELTPDEVSLLESLFNAAEAYLSQAGISRPAAGSSRAAQYDLLVNAQVLESYDRRDMMPIGSAVIENPAFRRILNQMKLSEPVPNLDTGADGGG